MFENFNYNMYMLEQTNKIMQNLQYLKIWKYFDIKDVVWKGQYEKVQHLLILGKARR